MTPRSDEQFAQIRQQSRKKIQETALELFSRQGYHSTSISQIAKAAGVSKGLMYNYFNSKDDLLKKLVEQEVSEGEAALDMALSTSVPPYQKLKLIIEETIRIVQTDVRHWKLVTTLSMQEEIMQQVKDLVQQKMDQSMQQMIQLFADLGVEDPETEAWLFGATLDGLFLHYLTAQAVDFDYPLEQMKQKLLSRYAAYKTTE